MATPGLLSGDGLNQKALKYINHQLCPNVFTLGLRKLMSYLPILQLQSGLDLNVEYHSFSLFRILGKGRYASRQALIF